MPHGICRLCLQTKELQDSHLLGRAVYKLCRQEGDPIVMTPDLVLSTSRQVRDYLFCWECEQRFSREGEHYVSRMVCRKASFELLDLLQQTVPIERGNTYDAFSGARAGVDTQRLAYYALSVLWRAAIHSWQTVADQTTTVTLDTHSEEIRKYLLGETTFPSDVAVVVTVCRDMGSQGLVFTPSRVVDDARYRKYSMLVRGVYFRTILGVGSEFHQVCCYHSPSRALFVDGKDKTCQHPFQPKSPLLPSFLCPGGNHWNFREHRHG